MRLTLTRSEIEKICVDRFRLMDDLMTDLTTLQCKWLHSEPGLLEIIIEPLHISQEHKYEVLK